ncbi:MAG: hypothetical protein HY261_03065 [Chloroflexi bacterium]|nr:hypothetical protein [Chloroflexota bacterium]
MPKPSPIPEQLSPQMRQRLRDLRDRLLKLHKALLDDERIAYERVHGRVTGGEMLQLVISHEWFAWLHPVSELVVQVDEMLDGDEPAIWGDAQMLLAHARILLMPSETGQAFSKKYYSAIQREPAVVLAHAEVRRVLAQEPNP